MVLVLQVLGTQPGRGVLLQQAAGMLGASARLLVFATGERALGQREGGHRLVAEAAVSDRREPPGAGIVGLLGQRDGKVLQRCAVHLAGDRKSTRLNSSP